MTDAKLVPANPRRSGWTQPAFLVAAGILAFSAVSLNVAVSKLQLHFKKLPVAPARPLAEIPKQMGPWVQVSIDEPLAHDVQDTLGTDLYVMRYYVDTRRLSPADLAAFDGLDSNQRNGLADQMQQQRPDAVLKCDVTYYTGSADTVAHIPERCYVADGYLASSHDTLTWGLGPDFAGNNGDHKVDVEMIHFEDQTGAARATRRTVAYLFNADGHWESDSIGVRERLQDLRATHGFYSKVELMTDNLDPDRCSAMMTDFLTNALPQVQKCYPDWDAVEHPGAKGHG